MQNRAGHVWKRLQNVFVWQGLCLASQGFLVWGKSFSIWLPQIEWFCCGEFLCRGQMHIPHFDEATSLSGWGKVWKQKWRNKVLGRSLTLCPSGQQETCHILGLGTWGLVQLLKPLREASSFWSTLCSKCLRLPEGLPQRPLPVSGCTYTWQNFKGSWKLLSPQCLLLWPEILSNMCGLKSRKSLLVYWWIILKEKPIMPLTHKCLLNRSGLPSET